MQNSLIQTYSASACSTLRCTTACTARATSPSGWRSTDFDEYLEAVAPLTVARSWPSMRTRRGSPTGATRMTLTSAGAWTCGTHPWGSTLWRLCTFRVPHPICEDKGQSPEYCIMGPGHRKLIYNPRRVRALWVLHPPCPSTPPTFHLCYISMRRATDFVSFSAKGLQDC